MEAEWASGVVGRTSGDLGLLIAAGLASDFVMADRQLSSWLESWELDFNQREEKTEVATLSALRMLGSEFGRRLSALKNAAKDTGHLSWFPNCTDKALVTRFDDHIDRSLRNLRLLAEGIRGATDVHVMTNLTVQLALATTEQQQGKKSRQQLELVAALLLVPTLIAGVYGANTSLPGRDTWGGFFGMVVLMAVTATAAALLLVGQRRSSREV